jgi:O-antigen ligase
MTASILLAGIGSQRPEYVVLCLVAVRPLVDLFVTVEIGGVSIGVAWGAALTTASAFHLLGSKARDRREHQAWRLTPLVFIACYALLVLPHGEYELALGNLVRLASWILLMLSVERMCRVASGQRMVLRTAYITVLLVVAVTAVLILEDRFGASYYSLVQSQESEQGPHQLAFSLSLGLVFVLVGLLAATSRTKGLIVLAVAMVLELILSFARTAWVGVLPVLLTYLALATWRQRLRSLLTVTLLVALALLLGVVSKPLVAGRLEDLPLIGDTTSVNLGSGRIGIWEAVLRDALSSWPSVLYGQGAGASRLITQHLVGTPLWAHNDFLELLLSGGLPLLLAYFALVFWMAKRTLRLATDLRQSEQARAFGWMTLAGLAGYVIMSVLNGAAFYQASILLALAIGLAHGMAAMPGLTVFDRPPAR